MGSVIDYIACPNCGCEAQDDFYYKTGEEYINCNNCGYHKSATIINREKKLTELVDEDWDIVELSNPYGAFRLKYMDEVSTLCGSLASVEQLNTMRDGVNETALANNKQIELFTVSRYVDGEIVVEHLIDNTDQISNKFDGE